MDAGEDMNGEKILKIRGSDKPDRIMETFLRHVFYAGRH